MRWPVGHKNRKARQDRSAFAALIASPASGSFGLPANANLFLRSVAGCSAGTTAATIGSRTIKTPLLAAGEMVEVGLVERGVTVVPVLGFDVLIDMGLGRSAKVGEGA